MQFFVRSDPTISVVRQLIKKVIKMRHEDFLLQVFQCVLSWSVLRFLKYEKRLLILFVSLRVGMDPI